MFNGIEVSQTGVLFQKGYDPKRKESAGGEPAGQKHAGREQAGQEPTGQEPTGQEPTGQRPARQELAREEPEVQAYVPKRKRPATFQDEVVRPQYGSSAQNDLERRQVAGPKRVRRDTHDYGEPSASMGHLWPAEPAVGSRLRPVEILENDVRGYGPQFQSDIRAERPLPDSGLAPGGIFEGGIPEYGYQMPSGFPSGRPLHGSMPRSEGVLESSGPDYGYQVPSGFASGRPLYGSMPRSEGIFENGGPDHGSRPQGNAAATRPPISFESWPENVVSNSMPNYESQHQSGLAGGQPPNSGRRQHDVFEDGTRPPFQSGPTDSRLRGENILDADAFWGAPEYGYHAQHQYLSTGQVLGSDVWLPVPADNERNNMKFSGQMVGPKRKAQAPPKTPQQETSGAARVAPPAPKKAKGEKWKKKYTIDNCPVIVPNGEGFVELRCDVCHCNASAVTGRFWLGARGMQGHLRKIHKEIKSPDEIFARCSVRSVSAEEVRRIESGELEIEKLFYKTVKGDVHGEGAAGRAQRVGDGEREEGEAAAPPKRTRKVKVRDISKGKSMKSTTW